MNRTGAPCPHDHILDINIVDIDTRVLGIASGCMFRFVSAKALCSEPEPVCERGEEVREQRPEPRECELHHAQQ
jgi:hypothetical protein